MSTNNISAELSVVRKLANESAEKGDIQGAVFILLLSAIGIVGNSILIDVYIHSRKRVLSTYFIITLGIIDLIICSVVMPMRVGILLFQLPSAFCSFYLSAAYVLVSFSIFLFFLIAIDRYQSVCRLGEPLFSKKHLKFIFIYMISINFFMTVVSPMFLEGHVDIRDGNETVRMMMKDEYPCYVNSLLNHPHRLWDYRYVMHFTLGVMFTIFIICASSMYIRVFKVLQKVDSFRARFKEQTSLCSHLNSMSLSIPFHLSARPSLDVGPDKGQKNSPVTSTEITGEIGKIMITKNQQRENVDSDPSDHIHIDVHNSTSLTVPVFSTRSKSNRTNPSDCEYKVEKDLVLESFNGDVDSVVYNNTTGNNDTTREDDDKSDNTIYRTTHSDNENNESTITATTAIHSVHSNDQKIHISAHSDERPSLVSCEPNQIHPTCDSDTENRSSSTGTREYLAVTSFHHHSSTNDNDPITQKSAMPSENNGDSLKEETLPSSGQVDCSTGNQPSYSTYIDSQSENHDLSPKRKRYCDDTIQNECQNKESICSNYKSAECESDEDIPSNGSTIEVPSTIVSDSLNRSISHDTIHTSREDKAKLNSLGIGNSSYAKDHDISPNRSAKYNSSTSENRGCSKESNSQIVSRLQSSNNNITSNSYTNNINKYQNIKSKNTQGRSTSSNIKIPSCVNDTPCSQSKLTSNSDLESSTSQFDNAASKFDASQQSSGVYHASHSQPADDIRISKEKATLPSGRFQKATLGGKTKERRSMFLKRKTNEGKNKKCEEKKKDTNKNKLDKKSSISIESLRSDTEIYHTDLSSGDECEMEIIHDTEIASNNIHNQSTRMKTNGKVNECGMEIMSTEKIINYENNGSNFRTKYNELVNDKGKIEAMSLNMNIASNLDEKSKNKTKTFIWLTRQSGTIGNGYTSTNEAVINGTSVVSHQTKSGTNPSNQTTAVKTLNGNQSPILMNVISDHMVYIKNTEMINHKGREATSITSTSGSPQSNISFVAKSLNPASHSNTNQNDHGRLETNKEVLKNQHVAIRPTSSRSQESSSKSKWLHRKFTFQLSMSTKRINRSSSPSSSKIPEKNKVHPAAMSTKIVRRLFMVTLFYYLCWLPFYLIELGFLAYDSILIQSFFLANMVNPFIHLTTSKLFRRECMMRLKLLCSRKYGKCSRH